MTRVKVCGNRSPADLRAARSADALGFVVASPGSRRSLAPSRAARLVARVPPFVQSVLVTRETRPRRLAALARAVPADAVQVHGLEGPREARAVRRAVGKRLILAVGVGPRDGGAARALAEELAPHADAVLLDSRGRGGETGGTGLVHDWRASARIARALPGPAILAGGLTPGNVAQAVRLVRPWAVDVSSGVEGPGGKSRAKVEAFLRAVRGVG